MRTSALSTILLGSLLLNACTEDSPRTIPGTVEYDRISLSSPISEPIIDIAVEEGDRVAAGTPILTLDDAALLARRAQLEAQRDQTAASLAEVLRGPREELVAADRARLDGALAELEDARADLARLRELRKRGLIPQADVDQAEARFGRAQAARNEAAKMLEAAVTGSTREEIEQARQRLAAAEAAVQGVAVDLRRLNIVSPIDGLIEALPYEAGEQPQAGAPLAILIDTSRPYARIYLPQPWRGHIGRGDRLVVQLGGRTADGIVRRVGSDPVFTPYYSLTEQDRDRLAYLVEVDLPADTSPDWAGAPLEVELPVIE